jgi:pyruvate dehydrogenase E2 component (dihydrolipoamide acetyltransferase)
VFVDNMGVALATNVILPALEMAQETGKILRWLKAEGSSVMKGEPIVEIETDKVTVEIEAPASGTLSGVSARAGDVIPVGQTIAWILATGESILSHALREVEGRAQAQSKDAITASPVARRIAAEHGVDLARVKPQGGRIEKADVLAFIEKQRPSPQPAPFKGAGARLLPASPKARRLATERGIDISTLRGTGPDGAVLATDVLAAPAIYPTIQPSDLPPVWRVMAERMTTSWTNAPHFYLLREANARRLIAWRDRASKRASEKITFTDLLVKIVAAALRQHPRLNAAWSNGTIKMNDEINIGLAVAIEDGLIVPVVHRADALSLGEIAARRSDLVNRAQAGKLRLEDLRGGTFTLSNLGMYGMDAFNAIVVPPQAAILAVGRIAERVVPVNGQPAIQPTLILTLSCDHRVVDGARGAPFLATVADLIEEPLGLQE